MRDETVVALVAVLIVLVVSVITVSLVHESWTRSFAKWCERQGHAAEYAGWDEKAGRPICNRKVTTP